MPLALQDFTALVRNQSAAIQGAATTVLDLTVGSVLRAVIEANASLALWMQYLIVQVLATTRAATSTGRDLDTWMADFGVNRLPPSPSEGAVLLSRIVTGVASLIVPGVLLRTADASQTYQVIAQTTHPSWTPLGFVLTSGVPAIAVPIAAVTPGVAGNVQANTITLLATAIAGIDSVNNPAATAGGMDAETDAALRARFTLFLDSRTRATTEAIDFAIASLRQGLRWAVAAGVDATGAPSPGNIVITVDDGTGVADAMLLSEVSAAVDAVRPIGSTFGILPPQLVRADISMTLSPPGVAATVGGAVGATVTAWIRTLPIGAGLKISRVVQLAFSADPAVQGVDNVLIAGQAADLVIGARGLVQAGTITAS